MGTLSAVLFFCIVLHVRAYLSNTTFLVIDKTFRGMDINVRNYSNKAHFFLHFFFPLRLF